MFLNDVDEPRLKGDELLGCTGVDGHRVVKVLLCCAHSDGDGHALHHLVNVLADSVGANHFKMGPVVAVVLADLATDQLEQTLLLVMLVAEREKHVCKSAREDLHVFFAELGLGISF